MTIVVLGAGGQVGSHLRDLLPEASCWGRDEADLDNPAELEGLIRSTDLSLLVNCAAYTAVDGAEREPELAWRVNAESPAAIARAASAKAVPVVHISTDYVFDGNSDRAYRANDSTHPINNYGRTKLAGDLAVQTLCPRHWILRTSWVFSENGANFVKTMLRVGRERDRLSIVNDQYGRPTYAGDIAQVIARLANQIEMGPPDHGIYNIGGGPETSWFNFAVEIFQMAKERQLIARIPELTAIPTSQYPTPAQRPLHSTLETDVAFLDQIGATMDWRRGLALMFDHIDATE